MAARKPMFMIMLGPVILDKRSAWNALRAKVLSRRGTLCLGSNEKIDRSDESGRPMTPLGQGHSMLNAPSLQSSERHR